MSIRHFENGAAVWVTIGKVTYAVKDSSDVSTSEHGYELFKVELQQEMKLWDESTQVRKWIHPRAIQGYKLKKRRIDDKNT